MPHLNPEFVSLNAASKPGRVKPEIATLSAMGKTQNFDFKCIYLSARHLSARHYGSILKLLDTNIKTVIICYLLFLNLRDSIFFVKCDSFLC